jgi:hypothetical protein
VSDIPGPATFPSTGLFPGASGDSAPSKATIHAGAMTVAKVVAGEWP